MSTTLLAFDNLSSEPDFRASCSLGLFNNCLTDIKARIEDGRSGQYETEETMDAIERNCEAMVDFDEDRIKPYDYYNH